MRHLHACVTAAGFLSNLSSSLHKAGAFLRAYHYSADDERALTSF